MNTAIKAAAVVAVLAMVLGAVMVADDTDAVTHSSGGITYDLTERSPYTATVTGYTGSGETLSIPASVSYNNREYNVTAIAAGAFSECDTLTAISIPSSVTSISSSAFDGCSSLTSITVDSSNREYASDDGVLYTKSSNTSWSMYSIPEGKTGAIEAPSQMTAISDGVFDGTGITSLTINEGFRTLRADSFEGSQLTTIHVPSTVTTLPASMFAGNTYLQTVTWASGESTYTVGANAFDGCTSLRSIQLPDGNRLTINDNAFRGCTSLSQISLPDSLRTISEHSFSGSGITSVTIPEGVTTIEEGAFSDCARLVSITIPSTVSSIPASMLSGCSSLASLNIPASITSIGNGALDGCSALQSITVAEDSASFISESGVLYTENMQTLVKYPAAVSATQFVVPSGVTTVSPGAFALAKNLVTVEMPASITSIGASAFQGCSALRTVAIESDSFTVGSQAFDIQPESPATLQVFTDAPQFGDAAFGSDVTPDYREYKNYGIRDSDELMGDALIWILVAIVLGVIFLAVSLRARAN